MTQTRKASAAEAATNAVLGIVLNQLVLAAAGIPLGTATVLTATMILLSTARSYAVRRLFNR